MSFVLLCIPEGWLKQFEPEPFVMHRGPRSPFECIMIATDQQIGLYVRPLLPRLGDTTDA